MAGITIPDLNMLQIDQLHQWLVELTNRNPDRDSVWRANFFHNKIYFENKDDELMFKLKFGCI